jgi:hypothetical protein
LSQGGRGLSFCFLFFLFGLLLQLLLSDAAIDLLVLPISVEDVKA